LVDLSDLNEALNIAEGPQAIVVDDSSIIGTQRKIAMIRVALTATAALFSCATALADPPTFSLSDRPSQDGRCIGDKGVGDLDRSERACLEQVGDLGRRVGPGLQLKFRNGLARVYLNEDAKCQTPKAEGCVKYRLTGYFPKHDLLLIEVGYWEGGSWLLVHVDSGKTSEIVAPPHYSPGKLWLVSVASGVGPSGPPDGIDIVPATSDPSLKEWHYRSPDDDQWLYEFAGWEGDDHVELVATSTETPTKRVTAFVERRNGDWHLAGPK
jgi:hypothetical protein